MKAEKPNWAAECPKCGNTGVCLAYCAGGSRCTIPYERRGDSEHMDRTCRLCGYQWTEPCLDVSPRSRS